MNLLKTIVPAAAIGTVVPGPALAQQVQLQVAMEIDCSAYHRNADGSWTALRANKILARGQVWREVVPGDNLVKLIPLLDGLCGRSK